VHGTGIEPVVKKLKEVYGRVSKKTLKHWRHLAQQNGGVVLETRGKKRAEDFEIALLSELVYVASAPPPGDTAGTATMLVAANAMFTYDLIGEKARRLQESVAWRDHPTAKKLKFSDKWIRAFLQRHAFKKRRITTVHKRMPNEAEVRAAMEEIARVQQEHKIQPGFVVNLDESGIFWGAAPKHLFAQDGARTGEVGDHDEKSRFTVELAATGEGSVLPYFIVIKCSPPSGSNPFDYSNMRVLHNLHKEPAFSERAGWKLKQWNSYTTMRRTKQGEVTNPPETVSHFRFYLEHQDGHVITCQPKAWMDMSGFAMYADTLLIKWWQKQKESFLASWSGPDPPPKADDLRMLIVADNAGVHKSDELRAHLEKHGILIRFLPPNMTAWLQPLDLVVCGLVKLVQRRRRGARLAVHLSEWRADYVKSCGEAMLAEQPRPPVPIWHPPKPTLMEGIFQYHKTHNEELQSDNLKSALVKCFQATGITPTSSGTYKQFRFDTFKSHGNHKTNAHLFKVYELQEKERIHACMLLGGLDDQDPNDWDDAECRTADDTILCSSDSEDAEELPSTSTNTVTSSTGAVLSVPAATMCSSDGGDSEEDGEDSEELDSADAGPSGEYSTKRGAPVTGSGGGGKRRKG